MGGSWLPVEAPICVENEKGTNLRKIGVLWLLCAGSCLGVTEVARGEVVGAAEFPFALERARFWFVSGTIAAL